MKTGTGSTQLKDMLERKNRAISIKQTCQKLGISEMQLWRLRKADEFSHLGFPSPIRYGRRVYFIEGEIDAFMESRRVQEG